jgi:hypothetical protein
LRSGEYGQTYGYLCEEFEPGKYAFCALGVLCDVHAKQTGRSFTPQFPSERGVIDGTMPREVQVWAGLKSPDPEVRVTGESGEPYYAHLTDLNDMSGYDFARIADAIERHWCWM